MKTFLIPCSGVATGFLDSVSRYERLTLRNRNVLERGTGWVPGRRKTGSTVKFMNLKKLK